MQERALAYLRAGQEVGFVPTMGALHAGHESLVRRAKAENDRVVVSVFVNPLQFGPSEDLARYPRPFERDVEILEQAGADVCFHPTVEQIYPPAFRTRVDPGPLADRLEGASRPGHFGGVLTVVCKLFQLVQPRRAYFGQKDVQQLILVRQMVRDLAMPVRIVSCPTVRGKDGLALSSRNVYLDPEQRRAAPALYQALVRGLVTFESGETDPDKIEAAALERLTQERAIAVDYLTVFEERTLARPPRVQPGDVLATAVTLGKTRLIDNVVFGAERL
jgi:pantoate--beta-alanine ligase